MSSILFQIKKLVKKSLEKQGLYIINSKLWSVLRTKNPLTRKDFLNLFFSQINPADFFFVQIGASDGKLSDPLYEHVTTRRLRGCVVEPQSDIFNRLKENYQGFPVDCIRAVIAKESGTMSFWVVKEAFFTPQNRLLLSQKSSLSKEVIMHTVGKKLPKGENPGNYIEPITVQALSFEDFTRKYHITKIDLLQIDAEGYDWEILKTVDLKLFQPRIINLETNHLSTKEKGECENYLSQFGYKFFDYENDTCAYKV